MQLASNSHSWDEDKGLIQMLLANGTGAFFLNIVSFNANKQTSPLAMNIGGITKQVLAIVLGIIVFHVEITSLAALGVLIVIGGIIFYSTEMYNEKIRGAKAQSVLPTTMMDTEKALGAAAEMTKPSA